MSAAGQPSTLPPIRDIAAELRGGADFAELCDKYAVATGTMRQRLLYAGYATTGHPAHDPSSYTPLPAGAYGNCTSGGTGGGDYNGLPVRPVLHTGKRRVFLGLDWSAAPATGPRWRWA